jgi:hypothetical protein
MEGLIMSHENFWLMLKAIAAYLDGGRAESEATLDALEKQLRGFDPQNCDSHSDDITLIIAQLSRLKMRMLVR